MKPNRGLSDWIWNHPHIDDMTKAQIVPRIRGKEETVARLGAENEKLREALWAQGDNAETYSQSPKINDVAKHLFLAIKSHVDYCREELGGE